jgi:hypothetical protein
LKLPFAWRLTRPTHTLMSMMLSIHPFAAMTTIARQLPLLHRGTSSHCCQLSRFG